MTSEERRASIVKAAMRLFAERGFRGTTTRELAAAVGVTEPIIYEHFRTKSDLYTAIIDAMTAKPVQEIEQMITHVNTIQGDRDFLIHLGQCIVQFSLAEPSPVRLLLYSNLEGHELKDLFHERQAAKFFGLIAGYLERRMAEGAMRSVDPLLAARAFFGMIAHYCLTGLLFQCGPLPKEPSQVVEEMVDIFLAGMTAKTTLQD